MTRILVDGIAPASDWKGEWIGLDGGEAKPVVLSRSVAVVVGAGAGARYFRRTIEVSEGDSVSDALAMFVGTGASTLYVNGKSLAEFRDGSLR